MTNFVREGSAMRLRTLAMAGAFLLSGASGLTAQEREPPPREREPAPREREPLPHELSWIGLYNGELLAWLENQNRMDELCPGREGSPERHDCRAEHLEPKVVVIAVRDGPEADGARVGEIVLLAVPGRGLRAYGSRDGQAQAFTPDLFDVDWGYGPWFHQTILERRGSWFRVPVPGIGSGWIDAEEWSDRRDARPGESAAPVETVRTGWILTTPEGDVVVLGVEDGVLRVRPEQTADMWCRGGDPPPLDPWEEIRIPFEELFDSEGHLRISYKYTRGC